jgi:hypothetical protein
VVGRPDDERASRATRLARAFRVPRLRFEDAAGVSERQGYVIDGRPESEDGLAALLALPADLVVHLRPSGECDNSGVCRVLDYYEARGVVHAFPLDAEDEDIIVAIEAAVRGRAGSSAHLPL